MIHFRGMIAVLLCAVVLMPLVAESASGRDGPSLSPSSRDLPPASGPQLWMGRRPADVERLLDFLPVTVSSPARQGILRRIVAAAVLAPDVVDIPGLAERYLFRLLQLGATSDVRDILAHLPSGVLSPDIQGRLLADALLVDGRFDEACDAFAAGVHGYQDAYWLKGTTFCLLRSGRDAEGLVQIAMLSEQGIDDPAFFAAAEAVTGLPALATPAVMASSPLTAAMLGHGGRVLSPDFLVGAAPWFYRLLSFLPGTDPGARALAGLKAFMAGSLDSAELSLLYRTIRAGPVPSANVLLSAHTPEAWVLLYHLALAQPDLKDRASVIAPVLSRMRRSEFFPAIAALYAPLIIDIEPESSLADLAGDFSRALYISGYMAEAGRWFFIACRGDDLSSGSLWAVDRLANPPLDAGRWQPGLMEAWQKAVSSVLRDDIPEDGREAVSSAALTTLVTGLFGVTGDILFSGDWLSLLDQTGYARRHDPSPARVLALETAIQVRHAGDMAALALLVLDQADADAVCAPALVRAVSALRMAGFDVEARHMAIETLVALGL